MNWLSRMLSAIKPPTTSAAQTATPSMHPLPNTVLIDVRSTGEFNEGHIEGAVCLPLDRIQHDITTVVPDKATPLLLYCRSGARSGRACEIVTQLGYGATRNGGAVGTLALSLGRRVVRT
jgi:phage shock protein E